MRYKLPILLICLIALGCNPAQKTSNYKEISYVVWGTKCTVIFKKTKGLNLEEDLMFLFDSLSASISTYDSSSLLSKVNRGETNSIDPVILELLDISKTVFEKSKGSFDPTIQPLAKEWGFLNQKGHWIDTSILQDILVIVGLDLWKWDSTQIISRPQGAKIDFNAIAPGYAADVIAQYLKQKGCQDFFINNGGEIVLSGSRPDGAPWKVGIVSPARKSNNQKGDTLYSLSNTAIATSGNYNNQFEYKGKVYSHTISPKTGMPIQSNLVSATVIASTAALADAYATVCMAMNKNEAQQFLKENQLQGYLIYKNKEGFIQRLMIN